LEWGMGAYAAPYLRYLAHVLGVAVERAQHLGIAIDRTAFAGPISQFKERVLLAIGQTGALLLNVGRISGGLAGATADDREREFAARLLERDYRQSCRDRFPIVDDLLEAMTIDAAESWTEFFDRLYGDRDELAKLLGQELGAIE